MPNVKMMTQAHYPKEQADAKRTEAARLPSPGWADFLAATFNWE